MTSPGLVIVYFHQRCQKQFKLNWADEKNCSQSFDFEETAARKALRILLRVRDGSRVKALTQTRVHDSHPLSSSNADVNEKAEGKKKKKNK